MESMRAQKSVTGVFSMCLVYIVMSCTVVSLFCCLFFVHVVKSCYLGFSNKVILVQNKT